LKLPRIRSFRPHHIQRATWPVLPVQINCDLPVKDGKYMLTDERGGTAMITIPNVIQSNGVIQVVNAVFMPN